MKIVPVYRGCRSRSRWLITIAGALALSVAACSLSGTPSVSGTAHPAKTYACAIDGAVQPIAVAVVMAAGGYGALAAALDSGIVHPLIVAWCARLNGTAVVVTDK